MAELSGDGEESEALLGPEATSGGASGSSGSQQAARSRRQSAFPYAGDAAGPLDKGGHGSARRQLSERPPREQLRGTLLLVGAVVMYSVGNFLVKTHSVPWPIVLQMRFSICLVFATCCMLYYRPQLRLQLLGPPELRFWVVLKGCLTFSFTMCWYAAISSAPLGECTAAVYCGPLVTAPLGYLFLGERFPRVFPLQVVMLVAGAVMVEDQPLVHRLLHDGKASPGALVPEGRGHMFLVMAVFLGGVTPLVTRMTHACSWIEVEHTNAGLSALVLNPLFAFAWSMVNAALPTLPPGTAGHMLLPLAVAGVLSFFGLAMETQGYQIAEPGKASSFRCLEIPFSFTLQHFGTSTAVTAWDVAGGALIIGSAALGGWSQHSMLPEGENDDERAALRDNAPNW